MKKRINGLLTLMLVLITQITFAQDINITGVVSDSNGIPVPGANVKVKGSSNGTSTDFDGTYKIKARSTDVLVYSYQGMNSLELKVSGAKMNARLSNKSTELEGVVVTGAVGIKKKKAAITSSYATVSNSELKAASNPDVVRSLVGKVSGITINSTSNGVNGSNSIRIRSMLSFNGSTEALVVIDNVISTADVLASLPSDIVQNVTVLKGAQGAALYGSQGKQGVVLVQTKKGTKNEKLSVTLSSGMDFENISFVPQRQQKYGQGWYGVRDPQENGGWGPLFDGTVGQVGIPLEDGSIIEAPYSSRGDDNIKEFYRGGTIFQNNLNLSMGGENGYLNLNLGNLRKEFIVEGDKLNRNSIVLNAGKKINKFTLGATFTLTNQRTKQANVNAATSRGDYTLLTNLLQAASNIPIGEFKDRGLYGWNGYYQNPFWAKENNRLNETNNFINFGGNAEYEINKHFGLSYNGSLQLRNVNQISYANAGQAPTSADGGFTSGAEFFQSDFSTTYYYSDLMANFNVDITKDLGFKLNLGQNVQYNYTKRVSQGGFNLEIPGLYNISNVLNPAVPSTLNNNTFETRTTATFANADLNFKDYLFLNATARYEGNSVAAKGNQFYFYPSVGISFIPTKAFETLNNKNTLSNLKLYANYTKIGSLDPISAYDILPLSNGATGFPFAIGNSFNNLTSITDPNIKPEKYTTLEGGINLGFFKDRITLDLAAYKTNTDDLITDASVSTASGLFNKKTNSGKLEGKGIEIDLSIMPINTINFKWNTRFSYTSNDTKVISSGESKKVVLTTTGNSQINGDISAVEGLPFPYITGTDWTKDNQGRVIVDSQGRPTPTSDFSNLGKVTPDYILGLTNSFEYKGIGLSFTMDYRTGHSFLSQTKYNLTWNGHLYESAEFDRNVGFLFPDSVIDDPSTTNVVDYIPNTNVLTGGFSTLTGAANRTQAFYGQASNLGANNLVDATAFRIREISLSYSVSSKILKNTGFDSFKVSINARNPYIKLAEGNRGYADPEASNQINNSTSPAARNTNGTLTNNSRNGLGYIGDAQYPSTRTFGFSINTTF